MRTIAIAITLTLGLFTLPANAQPPAGPPPPPGQGVGGPSGAGPGPEGPHRPPSPEEMATRLMEKFDANKDGELSQDELTKALEDLRQHRPRGPHPGEWQEGEHHKERPQPSPGENQGDGAKVSPTPGQGGPGPGHRGPGEGGERPPPPPPEKVAAEMIEKYSSDKKGLKQAELVKALAEHRAHRGERRAGDQHEGERPGE